MLSDKQEKEEHAFNTDETGLFHKAIGKQTYVTQMAFEGIKTWPEAHRKLSLISPWCSDSECTNSVLAVTLQNIDILWVIRISCVFSACSYEYIHVLQAAVYWLGGSGPSSPIFCIYLCMPFLEVEFISPPLESTWVFALLWSVECWKRNAVPLLSLDPSLSLTHP